MIRQEARTKQSSTSPLAGKVALVTGGSRNIGNAIVLELARQGAHVAINYVRDHAAARVTQRHVEPFGVKSILVRANVAREREVVRMIQSVKENFGRLDMLVNNADPGSYELSGPLEISSQDWQSILEGTLLPVLYCCKHAIQLMRNQRSGNIVNISAFGGDFVDVAALCLPYYIAKQGVISLTKVLAAQEARSNIRINAVSPTFVENYPYREPLRTQLLKRIPMQRFAKMSEIAAAVAFLAGNEANYITGSNLVVGGGLG